jgi:hypothetical protein
MLPLSSLDLFEPDLDSSKFPIALSGVSVDGEDKVTSEYEREISSIFFRGRPQTQ